MNDGSGDNHVFHLYVREKDAKAELWDGARSGTQAAQDVFNADEVCIRSGNGVVIITNHLDLIDRKHREHRRNPSQDRRQGHRGLFGHSHNGWIEIIIAPLSLWPDSCLRKAEKVCGSPQGEVSETTS